VSPKARRAVVMNLREKELMAMMASFCGLHRGWG
jgi:hypothetical protein